MEFVSLLAALCVGAAILAASLGILGGKHEGTTARLEAIASPGREALTSMGEPQTLRRIGAFDRRVGQLPFAASMRADIQRAGLTWQLRDYFGLMAVAAVLPAFVALVVLGPLPALGAAVLGALLPLLLVKRRAAKRATKLNAQLVDTVDLVASSLRSGFGFMQALELAAREQPDPIAGQLRHVIRDVNLGVSTDDALERLVARTADPDFDVVVTAVLIQRRVGGNLAEVLDNISQMIRDRVRVRGEIRTLTAQARMSSWIVGMLPLGLGGVMLLMQPDQMSVLFTDPLGRLLTIAAGVMQLIGFYLVRRIAAVDY